MRHILIAFVLMMPTFSIGQIRDGSAPTIIELPDPNTSSGCANGTPRQGGKVGKLVGSCPFDRPFVREKDTLTWKQTFNWKFWAVDGLYFAAMMKDQQDTLNGEAQGCALESGDNGIPYRATRGDLMKKNLPWFAGITVTSALLRKVQFPAWFTAPVVAAGKHSYGSYQWHQYCR